MTPVLGIIASSNQQGRSTAEGSYDFLATVTVSSAVASITFAEIPTGYQHLQLRSIAQTSSGGNWQRLLVAFNGDTTSSNYADHGLQGNGSNASAFAETSTRKGFGAAAASGANIFNPNITDILNYSSTTKNKVSRTFRGVNSNGSYTGVAVIESSLWLNTSAINSITLSIEDGSNFTTYTKFALYGVK
jgi:hypothetical protein